MKKVKIGKKHFYINEQFKEIYEVDNYLKCRTINDLELANLVLMFDIATEKEKTGGTYEQISRTSS
jgi:hypothetical protein